LRQWKQETWLNELNEEWAKNADERLGRLDSIQKTLTKEKKQAPPQWYTTCQGQTMVVIPGPVEFTMGSPLTETGRMPEELQRRMRIGRTFAISAKAVTFEQQRRFDDRFELLPEYNRVANLPAVGVSWYMAAKYCNWLSEQEGIPADEQCYEFNKNETQVLLEANYLKANYLSLSGYRLPTGAELEYAARAGATTSRFFGEAADLLPYYAWYLKNSEEKTWPVGSLKPNDFGLFDAHGNVMIWCQEKAALAYPEAGGVHDDREDDILVVGYKTRKCLGSAFSSKSAFVRSASRRNVVPSNRNDFTGFRVARTFPLSPAADSPAGVD
jgi:formylglycine-generating enzyme required for sulfatase activity